MVVSLLLSLLTSWCWRWFPCWFGSTRSTRSSLPSSLSNTHFLCVSNSDCSFSACFLPGSTSSFCYIHPYHLPLAWSTSWCWRLYPCWFGSERTRDPQCLSMRWPHQRAERICIPTRKAERKKKKQDQKRKKKRNKQQSSKSGGRKARCDRRRAERDRREVRMEQIKTGLDLSHNDRQKTDSSKLPFVDWPKRITWILDDQDEENMTKLEHGIDNDKGETKFEGRVKESATRMASKTNAGTGKVASQRGRLLTWIPLTFPFELLIFSRGSYLERRGAKIEKTMKKIRIQKRNVNGTNKQTEK